MLIIDLAEKVRRKYSTDKTQPNTKVNPAPTKPQVYCFLKIWVYSGLTLGLLWVYLGIVFWGPL